MSWAHVGTVLDPFHFLLTHKVKNNYYNDESSKQI